MEVKAGLRKGDEVVLGCVPEAIQGLQRNRLLLGQKCSFRVAQRPPDAKGEANRLVLAALLADRATPVEDRGLKQHFEGVVHQDQCGCDSPPLMGAIEHLDAEQE